MKNIKKVSIIIRFGLGGWLSLSPSRDYVKLHQFKLWDILVIRTIL